ncbi:unnamed protein product [Peronospora destructor]|uniref:FYVE-type domain-containing protein n=1 Tax=Peronospora destructor TaxID=86335 RepID=A0AAV0V7P2_9STRA|nr:unnamed protein product [Peronospora destructor]
MVTSVMESCRDHESRVAGFVVEDERSWQDVAHDSDLSIVRRKEELSTVTRTVGTVEVGFRQFVDFFSSETSEQLFAWNQFFLGCAVDAAVLCNLDLEKSDKQATLGIRWTCMQPSKLMRKRDECFLEYIVFKKDDQGRDIGVVVRLPVKIPECPPLPNELKTKRELITTVTLVRASDSNPNASQMFMLSQCEHKGLTASTKFCKKLLRALKNVSLSADAKRIATATCTLVEQSRAGSELFAMGDSIRPWVSSTGVQQNCTSCSRPFRNGHRRRQCQMCGDVYCSKCLLRRAGIRQHKSVFSNSVAIANQRTFRVVPSLFCKVCVSQSREENAEAVQEQIEASRRSLGSSQSSSVCRHSSMESSMQPASCTPVSPSTRSFQSQQTDAPRWWPDNESDTCSWNSNSGRFSFISRNYSAAPTARSSFSSDYSLGRNSFLAVQSLENSREIDVDRIDDRINERSSIYEVIDTKDMVPEKQQQNRQFELKDLSDDDLYTVRARYTSTPVAKMTVPPRVNTTRRTRSIDVDENVSSLRSLDQCIAEQNELLQQVLSASRGVNSEFQTYSTASSMTDSICEDDVDDSHDDSVFEL